MCPLTNFRGEKPQFLPLFGHKIDTLSPLFPKAGKIGNSQEENIFSCTLMLEGLTKLRSAEKQTELETVISSKVVDAISTENFSSNAEDQRATPAVQSSGKRYSAPDVQRFSSIFDTQDVLCWYFVLFTFCEDAAKYPLMLEKVPLETSYTLWPPN